MPIHQVEGGWKWGEHGHVYPTREGAEKQAEAAYAHGYKGDEKPKIQQCAGILFRASGPKFLLLKRSDRDEWEGPGGHIKDGETPFEAAQRESSEEIGYSPSAHSSKDLGEVINGNVSYRTFLNDVETVFTPPSLNKEHTDWVWATPENLPETTHPDLSKNIKKIGNSRMDSEEFITIEPKEGEFLTLPIREDSDEPKTELDVARLISEGSLSSPQQFGNFWLFDVRITGTDTAYREALDEYVYRPPEHYLNDEFLARCNGLPVIVEHPEGKALDTEEFRKRIIGTIFLPYIKGDEVWGIAKIFDEAGAELMLSTHGSTSPAVVFQRTDGNKTVEMDDGKHLLIEGIPSLLDHLAICGEGVWDKGNGPSGVDIGDAVMPETDKEVIHKGIEETTEGKEDRKDADMPAWADSLVKKMDSILEKHDSLSKRMDSYEKKDESKEEKEHKEEGEDIKKLEEAHKEEGKAEKDHRKDEAEKEKKEERKDFGGREDARMDSVSKELAEFREWKKSVSRPLSHAEKDELAALQSRFDSLAARFGETVQPPLLGETPTSYHRRLISRFQKHSERCKNVRLDSLDAQSFPIIADQIYADAQSAASNASMLPSGGLRSETFTDFAGRKCTRYFGDIKSAFAPWVQKTLKVKLNTSLTSKK